MFITSEHICIYQGVNNRKDCECNPFWSEQTQILDVSILTRRSIESDLTNLSHSVNMAEVLFYCRMEERVSRTTPPPATLWAEEKTAQLTSGISSLRS